MVIRVEQRDTEVKKIAVTNRAGVGQALVVADAGGRGLHVGNLGGRMFEAMLTAAMNEVKLRTAGAYTQVQEESHGE